MSCPAYSAYEHSYQRKLAKAEWMKKYRKQLRHEAIVAYGGKCVDCPETREEELEFDHPDGNGNIDRNEVFGYGHSSPGGWNYLLKLKQLGFPKGRVVLRCTGCHNIKHPNRVPKEERKGSPAMQNPDEYKREIELFDPVPF